MPWNIPGTGQIVFQGGLVGNDIFGTPSIGKNVVDSGKELYNVYGSTGSDDDEEN